MSAVDNLLKRKGAATVETAEIIKDGEHLKVDRRRALSYVSRGLAEWAVESAEEPTESEQPAVEAPAPAAPAGDPQVAANDAQADYEKYVRTLGDMTRAELVALAEEQGLAVGGNKTELTDRLSAAYQAGATAEDVPLSESDSDGD